MTEDQNDYDKTDIDYRNLVEGNDCQPHNNWLTHPNLDPRVVAEGERFLRNKMTEKDMATKSTMPEGLKPEMAPKPDPYVLDDIKKKFLLACAKWFDEATK